MKMKIKRLFLLLAGWSLATPLLAQIGGNNTYEFLNLPVSAQQTALGGNSIPVFTDDLNLTYQNPAALNPAMHQQLTFNSDLYYAGIKHGYAGYGHHLEKYNFTVGAGLNFVHYGKFTGMDANGATLADFVVTEQALVLTAAKQEGPYSYGTNLKMIYSSLESYKSLGVAADFAGAYHDTARQFTATLVMKNVGRQITYYRPGVREPMPFDIQIGLAHRLKHLPFRLSLVAHNLQSFDIRYNNPNEVAEVTTLSLDSTSTPKQKKYIADKIFRHFIFGGELFLGKNMRVMIGYNHLRRKELTTDTKRGMAGFSGGLGVRVKSFNITYGRSWYFVAGATNHFSIATPLSTFSRQRIKKEADEG